MQNFIHSGIQKTNILEKVIQFLVIYFSTRLIPYFIIPADLMIISLFLLYTFDF